MAYKAIYRTYRPTTFDDVVGQEAIVKTLKHSVSINKIAHAYLFAGPAGTGKTSMAKLMAKAINCTCEDVNQRPCNQCDACVQASKDNNPDIIEIDAASNNGVDQIRDIIDQVKYPPLESKYKVYIIDEVHMLSTGAFNALLKTLEEPPSYVVFILATTEPHKVLPTIISRCQRYDFRKVDKKDMRNRLEWILEQEHIKCDEDALDEIIALSDGGMRDALSILDQCIAYAVEGISSETVNSVYGLTSLSTKLKLIHDIINKDVKAVMDVIEQLDQNGCDFKRLILDLLNIYKEAVTYLYTSDLTLLSICDQQQIEELTYRKSAKQFLDSIDIWMKTNNELRFARDIVAYFEISCLKNMDIFTIQDQVFIKQEEVRQPVQSNVSRETFQSIPKPISTPKVVIEPVTSVIEDTIDKQEPISSDLDNSNSSTPVGRNNSTASAVVTESIEQPVSVMTQPVLVKETPYTNEDYVLSYLVQASKQCKQDDEERLASIEEYRMDIKSARLISFIEQCNVFASGDKFLILESNYDDIVTKINENETKENLEQFYRKCFRLDKRIFAISTSFGKIIRSAFVTRRKNQTLPQPIEILFDAPQNSSNEFEEKLKNIFKDKLEIEE